MAVILAFEEERLREDELKIALEQPGHKLMSFSNHILGLQYLDRNEVDLLLCSMHLQNASSFEILHAVKADPKRIDVPFLFYCIEPSDLTKPFVGSFVAAAKRLGADDVIVMEHYDADLLLQEVEKNLPTWVNGRMQS